MVDAQPSTGSPHNILRTTINTINKNAVKNNRKPIKEAIARGFDEKANSNEILGYVTQIKRGEQYYIYPNRWKIPLSKLSLIKGNIYEYYAKSRPYVYFLLVIAGFFLNLFVSWNAKSLYFIKQLNIS